MDSVLYVSLSRPGARLFGSDTRMVRVLDWFRERGMRVHFVHLMRKLITSFGHKPTCYDSFHEVHVAGCTGNPAGLPLEWCGLTRPRTSSFHRYLSSRIRAKESLHDHMARLIRETNSNLLWIDHTSIAPVVPPAAKIPGVLRICDTIDILYLRDETLRAAGLHAEQELSRADEQRLLLPFDVVVAIQDQERQELQSMLPGKTVITVGHASDVSPQPCYGGDLGFVGSKYHVNRESLLTFLKHSWPAIRQRCPGTRLQVMGGVGQCPEIVEAGKHDSRIILRGIVPRVADIYAGPAVFVCPLWTGSGLKIKMVEALSHGKAVVASPIASQGLDTGIGSAFQVAATPADFIEPVVALLQNQQQRRQLEQGAINYARQHFHTAAVWREMEQVLRQRNQSGAAPKKAAA